MSECGSGVVRPELRVNSGVITPPVLAKLHDVHVRVAKFTAVSISDPASAGMVVVGVALREGGDRCGSSFRYKFLGNLRGCLPPLLVENPLGPGPSRRLGAAPILRDMDREDVVGASGW